MDPALHGPRDLQPPAVPGPKALEHLLVHGEMAHTVAGAGAGIDAWRSASREIHREMHGHPGFSMAFPWIFKIKASNGHGPGLAR